MKSARPRRFAPVCYGHVGGILGERMFRAFVRKGWLSSDGERISPKGLRGLAELRVPVELLSSGKRKPVNACVERHAGRLHPHVGSHLSSLLVETLVERGWLKQEGKDFTVTPQGRRGLTSWGVDSAAPHPSPLP